MPTALHSIQRRSNPRFTALFTFLCAEACADPGAPLRTPGPDGDVGAFTVDLPALSSAQADDAAILAEASTVPSLRVDTAAGDAGSEADAVAQRYGRPDGACTSPLAPGDLQIDELMIESVSGVGDYGEWLEFRNVSGCVANLRGLHGECPRGSKVSTFDVGEDLWLEPRGTFVVADSSDPAINHSLPGNLLMWAGRPGDALRNKGATVTLRAAGALIDSVTYPSLKPTVGASLAFPSDCDAALRIDWSRWQTSVTSWFPGFAGTPNAPNDDVHCP